ncbi:hypothetical protein Nepgr_006094 [Nepenthes gracilis]|uniref:Uncharacterized protein n=1 Tax=Nepenthes gracilis TaxID=150966 RepID=A0AAD3S4I3_NEPGR|nr:hypothetical protein Nepgr_006094 [Nepenthes gracilis]
MASKSLTIDVFLRDIIGPKDVDADTDMILAVQLLHTTIADWGSRVWRSLLVTTMGMFPFCCLLYLPRRWTYCGFVSNVHESGVHHLFVHRVLGCSTKPTSACVKIIDEHSTHFPLGNYLFCLTVSLPC